MAVNASGAPGGTDSPGAVGSATPTLQLRGISKAFGTVQALQNVDFEVHAGEVVGLVGDNGAGKSTLIKIMAGVYVPDTGEIDVDGRRVSITSPQDATRVGIETVYQDLALCDNLDVVANLFLGREEYVNIIPFVVRPMNEVDMERRAREVLRQLEVKIPSLRTPVAALSGGQRQSIAVAKTILRNAKVVLLDEPTAALGVAQTRQVLNLIQRLRSQGLAVVVISHNLADVFEVVDRVIVMRLGQRVATFDVRNATSEQVVAAITGAEFGMGGPRNGANRDVERPAAPGAPLGNMIFPDAPNATTTAGE
jgi:D-xylose transport system ATP-binding protein